MHPHMCNGDCIWKGSNCVLDGPLDTQETYDLPFNCTYTCNDCTDAVCAIWRDYFWPCIWQKKPACKDEANSSQKVCTPNVTCPSVATTVAPPSNKN